MVGLLASELELEGGVIRELCHLRYFARFQLLFLQKQNYPILDSFAKFRLHFNLIIFMYSNFVLGSINFDIVSGCWLLEHSHTLILIMAIVFILLNFATLGLGLGD